MAATLRPSRLSTTSRRPSSAIYVGLDSSYSLPDLPDPPRTPSPGTSPNENGGLPSPPATNSTGSNGDDSNHRDSLRSRSPTLSKGNMQHVGDLSAMSYSSANRSKGSLEYYDDDDDADVLGNEDDNTAKFTNDRRRSAPPENSALQRIRDLNERSRQVMDNLRSRSGSRAHTPSPSTSSAQQHPTRSPHRLSSDAASTAGSSSSRSSRLSYRSRVSIRKEPPLSGSETERESAHSASLHSQDIERDDIDATPPGAHRSLRERRISAPSPAKPETPGLRTVRSRSTLRGVRGLREHSPDTHASATRRERPIVASLVTEDGLLRRSAESPGVASSASRRAQTTQGRRTRQPLPFEFVDNGEYDDERSFTLGDRTLTHAAKSPSSLSPETPSTSSSALRSARLRDHVAPRASTVRERRNVNRWLSGDISAPELGDQLYDEHDPSLSTGSSHSNHLPYGRRQAPRGGSAESPLVAYRLSERNLVEEGLRTAGINARRNAEESSSEHSSRSGRAPPTSITPRRLPERAGASSALVLRETRTPPVALSRFSGQRNSVANFSSASASRPATSAADYRDDIAPPQTAPPALRTYKSTVALSNREREGDWLDSPHRAQRELSHALERAAPARNGTPSRASGSAQQPEHMRLLTNALELFESALSHLPPLGTTSTSTIPEVFGHAQTIARTADSLNGFLRDAAEAALAEHVDASVDPSAGSSTEEIWRHVHGQFKDGVRASDELVRVLTNLFLGVGKILKDVTPFAEGDTPRQQPQPHRYSTSLDEDRGPGRASPSANGRRSVEGSTSSGSRSAGGYAPVAVHTTGGRATPHSRGSDGDNTSQFRSRLSDGGGRGSALLMHPLRDRDYEPSSARDTSDLVAPGRPSVERPPSSARRVFTPRDREHEAASTSMHATDSLETVRRSYESSPTTRWAVTTERSLRSVSGSSSAASRPGPTPLPLPTVLSESLITHPGDGDSGSAQRRKGAAATIRASLAAPSRQPPRQPAPSEALMPKLVRGDSDKSTRSQVTFSRPSTSAMSELQIRERSVSADEDPPAPSPASVGASLGRRRTLGPRSITPAARASLDSDRVSAAKYDSATIGRRSDRRRTVAEIFTRG